MGWVLHFDWAGNRPSDQAALFAHPLLFLACILFILSLLSSLLDHLFKFKNMFLVLKNILNVFLPTVGRLL